MTQPTIPPDDTSQPTPPSDDRPHKPADAREEIYYQASPQLRGEIGHVIDWSFIGIVLNARPFVWRAMSRDHTMPAWWLTLPLILLGLACFLVPWLRTRMIRYRISNYRIDYERGLLSRRIDTLELWHVEDIAFHQSLLDRIVGVGDIKVSDVGESALAAFGCDVALISDDGQPADAQVAAAVQRTAEPGVKHLLWETFARLRAEYESGGMVSHPARVLAIVRQCAAAGGMELSATQVLPLAQFFD